MDREQLDTAIAAQDRLRGLVADEIIDATIVALRRQLADNEPAQRRRQVTVLFADLSGFTALAEDVDPELVTRVMNDLWARLDEVIVGHGGWIDKHIGDALMGIWGSAGINEDDADQAVRAGLELQAALDQFPSQLGRQFALRVGINTGPVMLSAVGSTSEFTAIGDTVNVASRVEQAASPGTVLISHDTYRHVRGIFDVQRQAPLHVKGKSRPLQTYVVTGAKPRAFRVATRGVEGVETAMVGRAAELEVLCDAFRMTSAGGGLQAITVLGDAGAGKSRLLWEFDDWIELQPDSTVKLLGRAVPQRRNVPLALLRDVVAARFGIVDTDPPAAVAGKLATGSSAVLQPVESTVLGLALGFDLDGLPDVPVGLRGEQLALAGRAHLLDLVRHAADGSTVVVLLEDLQWADDESLSWLIHLLGNLASAPILIVGTSRPRRAEPGTPWSELRASGSCVDLRALAAGEIRTLVNDILQRVDRVPVEFVEFVVSRAEGNAFFAEELIKMLIDSGAVSTETDDGVWTISTDRLDAGLVPPTLTGVLQARLDALEVGVRVVLQAGSVVGRAFWDDAVTTVLGRRVDLEPAVDRELIFHRRPSTFEGCSELVFKHALLHDVTYATVLLSDRPSWHRGVAKWLEARSAERRHEFLIEVAEHYLSAGEFDEAAVRLLDAAERANLTASRSARALVERAIECWQTSGTVPPSSAYLLLATACQRASDLDAAGDAAVNAVSLARVEGNIGAVAEGLARAAFIAETLGDFARSRQLLDEAQPLGEAVGGAPFGRVLIGLAWSHLHTDELGTALDEARRSLSVAEQVGDPELLESASEAVGAVLSYLGEHEESRRHYSAAATAARASGNSYAEAAALSNLAFGWMIQADADGEAEHYRRAERDQRRALELLQKLGIPEHESMAMTNLATIRTRLGDPVGARQLAREAVRVATRVNAQLAALQAIVSHSEALDAGGDVEPAVTRLGWALTQPGIGELRRDIERLLDRRRAEGNHQLDQWLRAGQTLTLDDVVTLILTDTPPSAAD